MVVRFKQCSLCVAFALTPRYFHCINVARAIQSCKWRHYSRTFPFSAQNTNTHWREHIWQHANKLNWCLVKCGHQCNHRVGNFLQQDRIFVYKM